MKVSKNQLKDLIKECIVEVLAEGIGIQALSEGRRKVTPKTRNNTQTRRKTHPRPSPVLEMAVQETSGGDPIMRDILADTAKTTLPQMLSNDSHAQGGVPLTEHVAGTPEEIFGEENAGENGRWAELAFTNKKPALSTPSTSKIPDSILDSIV